MQRLARLTGLGAEISRHRHQHQPQETPPQFWDMGFDDSLDERVLEQRQQEQRQREQQERQEQPLP